MSKPKIDLAAIGHELRTQDNRMTNEPVFCVQQKRRLWGVDPDYHGGNYKWVNGEEGHEADEAETIELDAVEAKFESIPGEWAKIYYIDQWVFVTACLTEKAALAYLAINGHNLNEPRIYAESGWRNAEWIGLRELLMGNK